MKSKVLLGLAMVMMATMVIKAQDAIYDIPKEVHASDARIVKEMYVTYHTHDSVVNDPTTGMSHIIKVQDSVSVESIELPALGGPARAAADDFNFTDKDGIRIKCYVFYYPSVDANGKPITLSALLVRPRSITSQPLNNVVVGCHITITSNDECPSSYNSVLPVEGFFGHEKSDVGMLTYFATGYDSVTGNNLVIMSDYEGYGITRKRAHPYLYQELTARQVVDATRYGLALYQALSAEHDGDPLKNTWKLVTMGYSQGGSVALATHRFIEQNGLAEELHFAGSVCGDGPYDPLSTLNYYMRDNGYVLNSAGDTVSNKSTEHIKEQVTMPVVMPLILKGMIDSNPYMKQHKLTDYLSPMFLHTGVIEMIEGKANNSTNKTTDDIAKVFCQQCEQGITYTDPATGVTYHHSVDSVCMMFPYHAVTGLLGDTYVVRADLKYVLTPQCYQYFKEHDLLQVPSGHGDPMIDLHRALASNNMGQGWKPEHRIGFFHSPFDMVVPYDNYLSVKKAFQDAGTDMNLIYLKDNSEDDHVDAGTQFYFTKNADEILMNWVVTGVRS